eukprot:1159739-Pelagomonas_calceolata.AAC.10
MARLVEGMGFIDSPTHTQKDCAESDLGTLKFITKIKHEGTACNPPDPHRLLLLLLVKGIHGASTLAAGFEPGYSVGMVGSCSSPSEEMVGIRAKFNKVNVPVLKRDPSGINVGGSAWDREHEDSIRPAVMLGKGAGTNREKPVRESS